MNEPATLTTSTFRVSQAQILRHAFSIKGRWPAAICTLLFLGCLAAGIIFDLRFVIVAMMFLFIALPAVAAFLYFSIALRPSVAFNTLPHSVEIGADGARITVILPPSPEKEDDTDKDPDKDSTPETRTLLFPSAQLGNPVRTLSFLIYPISGSLPGFILIPYTALPSTDS